MRYLLITFMLGLSACASAPRAGHFESDKDNGWFNLSKESKNGDVTVEEDKTLYYCTGNYDGKGPVCIEPTFIQNKDKIK
jgi:galactose mutarotase-like enzyme